VILNIANTDSTFTHTYTRVFVCYSLSPTPPTANEIMVMILNNTVDHF